MKASSADSIFDPEILPGSLGLPANWADVFGRRAPLVVEIGSGTGRWLIGQAEAHPDTNYLAIETDGEYFYTMKERVAKRRLANMRVCRNDATDLIAHVFPDACVRTFHIYFPDPWPKVRHHKRRIFRPDFIVHLKRALEPQGEICFATDHQDYLLESLPLLRAVFDVHEQHSPWTDAPLGRTNFEIKYMREGRPIWRYVLRRK